MAALGQAGEVRSVSDAAADDGRDVTLAAAGAAPAWGNANSSSIERFLPDPKTWITLNLLPLISSPTLTDFSS